MRKMISLLLVLCMLLAAVPAFAEEMQVLSDGYFAFEIPATWKILQTGDGSQLSVSQLVPPNCDSAMILSIDYEQMPEVLREMEEHCTGWYDRLIYHMAVGWTKLGGDEALLQAILEEEYDAGFYQLINSGRDGILIHMNSEVGSAVQSQMLIFQIVENAGYVIYVSTTLPVDDSYETILGEIKEDMLMVHRSAQIAEGDAPSASGAEDGEDAADADAADEAAARVVITADSARIRTEQSISGGLIKTAYKGESFPCIGETNDWYVIEVNGRTGYVHKGVSAIQ